MASLDQSATRDPSVPPVVRVDGLRRGHQEHRLVQRRRLASYLDDTWTWDGSAWTKQAPAAHLPARQGASMAYDAATRNIVLFSGHGHFGCPCTGFLDSTWTWGGSG